MLVGWAGIRSLEEAHDFEKCLPTNMMVISQHSRVRANMRKAERTPSRLLRNASLICLSLCVTIQEHRAMSACQCMTEQMLIDESLPQSLGQRPPQTALRSGRSPQRIYTPAPGHSEHLSDDVLDAYSAGRLQ